LDSKYWFDTFNYIIKYPEYLLFFQRFLHLL
jgi:hypothetical protein